MAAPRFFFVGGAFACQDWPRGGAAICRDLSKVDRLTGRPICRVASVERCG